MARYLNAYSPIFGAIIIWWVKILAWLTVFGEVSLYAIGDLCIGLMGFDLWALASLSRGLSVRADGRPNEEGVVWYVILGFVHHLFGYEIWYLAMKKNDFRLLWLGILLLGAAFAFPIWAMGRLPERKYSH